MQLVIVIKEPYATFRRAAAGGWLKVVCGGRELVEFHPVIIRQVNRRMDRSRARSSPDRRSRRPSRSFPLPAPSARFHRMMRPRRSPRHQRRRRPPPRAPAARLDRAMSQHRVPRLDKRADTPDTAGQRPTPPPMGRSAPLPTVSARRRWGGRADWRKDAEDPPSFVVRKVTLLQSGRQQSAPRLGRKLSEHRLPRTMTRSGEAPRPTAPELRPSSPSGEFGPCPGLAPNDKSDLKKNWIRDINEVEEVGLVQGGA